MPKYAIVALVIAVLLIGGGAVLFFFYPNILSLLFSMSSSEKTSESYFEVSELGIRFPISADIADLSYMMISPDAAAFTTETLEKRSGGTCTSEHNPLGIISSDEQFLRMRGVPPEGTPDRENYILLPTNRWVFYVHPQATCSDDPDIQAFTISQIQSLRESFAKVELVPPEYSSAEVLEVTEIINYYGDRISEPTGTFSTTTRLVREPSLVEEWKHKNGAVVSLFEKDLIQVHDNYVLTASAPQMILKAKSPDGAEYELVDNVPFNPRLGSLTITAASFSPLGNYFSFRNRGYEGNGTATYDLKTGTEIFMEPRYYLAFPYWNSNETRLALIREAQPIDGTVAALFYSATGRPEDVVLVREFFTDWYDPPWLENEKFSNDTLTFDIFWSQKSSSYSETDRKMHGSAEAFSFDLNTGILVSQGTQQR